MFFGGFVTGVIITIVIDVIAVILWHKVIKKKVDEAIFKAGLKAIEKQKEKE